MIAEHDRKSYWHAGLFVLLAADSAFNPDSDAMGRRRGTVSLDALLAAARAHGFTLQTLLAKADYCNRTVTLACAVLVSARNNLWYLAPQ
jgi:hypothetical protein